MFRLIRVDADDRPAPAFEDSTNPGLVPVWEAIEVYDALYNSDGKTAREVSRAIAYGIDRLKDNAKLALLLPPTVTLGEAIRFLENVHRACIIHPSGWIETR